MVERDVLKSEVERFDPPYMRKCCNRMTVHCRHMLMIAALSVVCGISPACRGTEKAEAVQAEEIATEDQIEAAVIMGRRLGRQSMFAPYVQRERIRHMTDSIRNLYDSLGQDKLKSAFDSAYIRTRKMIMSNPRQEDDIER